MESAPHLPWNSSAEDRVLDRLRLEDQALNIVADLYQANAHQTLPHTEIARITFLSKQLKDLGQLLSRP